MVPQFIIGDWVVVTRGLIKGFVGYLVKVDLETEYCEVIVTRDNKGKAIKDSAFRVGMDYLIPYEPRIDEDSLLTLIDFALDMNDREWFKKLTSQLPRDVQTR